MKKIIIPLLVLILTSSAVLAGCPCKSNPGNPGTEEVSAVIKHNASLGQKVIQQKVQLIGRNLTEVRKIIQEKKQEMNQSIQPLSVNVQKVHLNQNIVRLAVHTLLAMENLTGGIGHNVSLIARKFNNSVQATIRAEVRIQTRSIFLRLLFGGNREATDEIEQEVNQNQQRIQRLRELLEKCDCDEEVKAMIQEQIENMEQEQNRLQELAQKEKGWKGLFGWLWK